MALIISAKIRKKLAEKHNVGEQEILECFASREKKYLEDTREDHKTDPPTLWFVAETDFGKKLKIVFMQDEQGDIHIKTAYPANQQEIWIYDNFA